MKAIKYLCAVVLGCCCFFLNAQNRNSVWCFGDSVGIDFSSGIPMVFASSIDSRGSAVSISDYSGSLLFYAATMLNAGPDPAYSTFIYSSNHAIMLNGDSIFGKAWYHELIAIPMPGNDSLFYIFSVGVTSVYGLKYSVIDIKANNSLGAVIQKNIQLQSFPMVDCLTAVKHGNGRDWWLMFRRWDPFFLTTINEFHTYLISPAGVTDYTIQNIGTGNRTNNAQITFNPTGNKFAFTNLTDQIEVYDFDRCTGIISNPLTIHPNGNLPPYQYIWSNAFSPNSNVLYVSTSVNTTSYLYQLDLTAANIYASRIDLDTFYLPPVSPGALKLAPDGKIYFSCAYDNGVQFNYPYKDSVYNYVNMNLSVINFPNNLGTACGYVPFSFYLGGKRTYYGLPNNPDYDMPALAGSPCDTLTNLTPILSKGEGAPTLMLTYVSEWKKLFVNAQHLKGRNVTVEVFDVAGKHLTPGPSPKERGASPDNGYFTQDVYLPELAAGLYVVSLRTEKEVLSKKFVVNH